MHALEKSVTLPSMTTAQENPSIQQHENRLRTRARRGYDLALTRVASFRASAWRKMGVIALASGAMWGTTAHGAGSVIFKPNPDPAFPIAISVEVPATASLVHLSGQVPPLVDLGHPTDSPMAYGGDTRAQSRATLTLIQSLLQAEGLDMGDVVKMQVYLVADPHRGDKMDFAGFAQAYAEFFGTPEQPNVPARSTFQVAGLLNPGWLVEIEVVAVRS